MHEILDKFKTHFFTILILGLLINGCHHGAKKHGEAAYSMRFFLSLYYGVEYFWHSTDYDQLNDYILAIGPLMVTDTDYLSSNEHTEYIKYKDVYRSYFNRMDDHELKYAKEGVVLYKDLFNSLLYDFYDSIENETSLSKGLKLSSSTDRLLEESEKYNLKIHFKDHLRKIPIQYKEGLFEEVTPNIIRTKKEKLEQRGIFQQELIDSFIK